MLTSGEVVRIFDGDLLWLVLVFNPGLAFGVRLIPPVILTVIAFIASAGLAIYLFRASNLSRRHGMPLALVMGGALGNLVDRIILGKVIDFISVDMPDFIMPRWPVFNVADSAVSIGITCLVVFTIFHQHKGEVECSGDVADRDG